jgi:NAD dependent epimerase/dehydratase family enzyme
MAGSQGYLGTRLAYHLERNGFNVCALVRDAEDVYTDRPVVTYDSIKQRGLPDMDFVINVAGSPIMNSKWDDGVKLEIESSRLNTNVLLAEAIRNSSHKPYAFIHASTAHYNPPSHHKVYDESFKLPEQPLDLSDPALHSQELSLPYWSRLARAWESKAQVFFDGDEELTPEELHQIREEEKQLFLENLEAPSMYNSRRNPRPEISARNMLLQNSDVRVVNMRMGALLAHNSPLVGALGWHADWGLLRHIGDGQAVFPWIHVDDACAMYLSALVSDGINGPVNCVAPTLTTNAELFKGIRKMRKAFTLPVRVKDKDVFKRAGIVKGSLLTEPVMVKPAKVLAAGFQFQYPTIADAVRGKVDRYSKVADEDDDDTAELHNCRQSLVSTRWM